MLNDLHPNRRHYNFDYNIYDDEQFKRRFRLTKEAFQELLGRIGPEIQLHNERGNRIPAEIQLLLTLRLYATGTFQLAIADLCEISQPSARRIIRNVSESIASLKQEFIHFPQGEAPAGGQARLLEARLTPAERWYNVAQIRTRNSIERMFGTWKRIFPSHKSQCRSEQSYKLPLLLLCQQQCCTTSSEEEMIPLTIIADNEPECRR